MAHTNIVGGFGVDLDEAEGHKPIAQQLREALHAHYLRVMDLFRSWDEDGSGSVDKKEFRMAMKVLHLDFPRAALDQLFDSWDADDSGEVSFEELHRLLRQGATVELDEKLLPGAAGEIELDREQGHALRKEKRTTGSRLLQQMDLDESEGHRPVSEQLRGTLAKNFVRVIDLFREWDEDDSGSVDKKEFRMAMKALGLEVPRAEVDQLFDSWDTDRSGAIDMKELNVLLCKRVDASGGPPLWWRPPAISPRQRPASSSWAEHRRRENETTEARHPIEPAAAPVSHA